MPAIFELYFARRGPFVAHLKIHYKVVQSQYMCYPFKDQDMHQKTYKKIQLINVQ